MIHIYYLITNNLYFLIFSNSMQSVFFLSLRSESAWFAALNFGTYNNVFITSAAVAGSTLGMSLNYGLGYYMSRWRDELPVYNDALYSRISGYFKRNLFLFMAVPPILLLEVMPGLGVYAMINGMFRVPPRQAIFVLAVSRALYYGYYLSQYS